MRLILAGLSHKTADTALRERLAALRCEDILDELFDLGWERAVVVSTCNRFEVYAEAAPHHAVDDLRIALERASGQELHAAFYLLEDSAAARHLFEVAAGLDSLVVGEGEIAGQLKRAYERSLAREQTGVLLNVAFQRALYLGKRVRSETGIGTGVTSVAGVAVQMAQAIFGDLAKSQALVLGAGEMAEVAMKHLQARSVERLYVANRTWERGARLAERFRAAAVRWEDFPDYLHNVDVVLCSTGADRPVVTRRAVEAALERRRGRSLFFIDIAMPRDVEEAVSDFENVYIYTLKDLEALVARSLGARRGEIASAHMLVGEKAGEFERWLDARRTGAHLGFKHSAR